MTEALTLADILDLRAYERVREDFRTRVIARKQLRRIALGPIMTLVFESIDTVRFQIQEMARVEKILSDEALGELLGGRAIANPSQLLVDAALAQQARDNVTAVVVDVLPPA